jgi:hypothetical protein
MMLRDNLIFKKNLSAIWPDLLLIAFIFYMTFVYVKASGNRPFNFDEFQVLYASSALERGRALYADQLGLHFPFFNTAISLLIHLAGFRTITILIARYFILLINMLALIFIYKIGGIIWDRRAGLLAVCLTLSSIVFLNKGIEIRHDVFNMTFNVIGAYYGIRYIKQKKYSYIILSGIFLGIALASTQKALIWNVGVIVGLSLYYLRDRSYKRFCKINFCYFITLLVPLIINLFYFKIRHNENIYMFLKHAVAEQIVFFAPHTKELYPFPFNRYELFKDLIFQNHLLYALAIGAILAIIIIWFRSNTARIIVGVWALIGVLFYVTAKRPFFQTFLPSVPPMCILAAGFLSDMFNDFRNITINKRIGVGTATIFLLFVWPFCLAYSQIGENSKMMRQMENISFCLESLKQGEKVLCFTQNQIYFDPVLKMSWQGGGKAIWEYDAVFFEQKMIKKQCKVIINDYRTRLLNKEIKEKIVENYLPIKTGDILIPGLKIGPKESFEKKIWIEGYYYNPTGSLEIDGKKIGEGLIKLKQKEYIFHNTSSRSLFLFYIFNKKRFLNNSSINKNL